jgi:galactokinase
VLVTDSSLGGPDFISVFLAPPSHWAAAPGRVNLIGEHTDYNDGFVLPTVIPQHTRVQLRPRADRVVRAYSVQLTAADHLPQYQLGAESRTGTWLDYVQGVTQALAGAGHGSRLRGFDLYVDSAIPLGSGLSSSAALEVSLLRALRSAFALPLAEDELAGLGQQAENQLVGVPCGIMDQLAVSLCPVGSALFLDTRTRQAQPIALPADLELLVIHSGLTHQLAAEHAGGDYKTRRAECARAAQLLAVAALRDVPGTAAGLERLHALPEPLAQRARHVVTENERVLRAVAALRAGELLTLGELLSASHRSLRDDFAVSLSAIDRLVELATAEPTVLGARLTGGGFGGSVVMLAERAGARATADRLAQRYAELTGNTPVILLPEPKPRHGR